MFSPFATSIANLKIYLTSGRFSIANDLRSPFSMSGITTSGVPFDLELIPKSFITFG